MTTVWLHQGTTGWTVSIVAKGYNPNNIPRILPLIPNLPIPPFFTAKQAPVRMSMTIYNCVVKDNAAQKQHQEENQGVLDAVRDHQRLLEVVEH